MLYKTQGIALSYIKFKESSIIARIFTRAFGMQSYIVNSVRTKSTKTRIALFQPLTILDLVVYHNKKKEINRISEIKCQYNSKTIPFNIKKTSIGLFLTELLNQTLHEEENEQLFGFIHDSIIIFDGLRENYENFHLQFMMLLSRHLGIEPQSARSMLKDVGHQKIYDKQFTEKVDFFILSNYDQHQKLGKTSRNEILLLIIDYYRFHYDNIRQFKSIQVLKEVLS
jgi:DNA repair protein RecO (recombination protein O)